MRFDVCQPIMLNENSRDEIFIVFFDGFIKNTSEGILRSMIRDYDDWILLYPNLKDFQDKSMEELYDYTMIITPIRLLKILSNNSRSNDDIIKDLDKINELVFTDNSQLTTFEFTLYNILREKNIKNCYFYKEGKFTQNEINYIMHKYDSSKDKIEIVDETNFPSLVENTNPTTIFINDPSFIFDYFMTEYDMEFQLGKLFIVLNTDLTMHYDEDSNQIEYNDDFKKMVEEINEKSPFSICPMFNFRIEENNNIYDPDMNFNADGKEIYQE